MSEFGVFTPTGQPEGKAPLRPPLHILNSQQVWLAVDEGNDDSKRIRQDGLLRLEHVTLVEMERYQRQLFFWLLLRNGPCIFWEHTHFEQGVPLGRTVCN